MHALTLPSKWESGSQNPKRHMCHYEIQTTFKAKVTRILKKNSTRL